ncbi:hypothetical protein [Nocardioides convexus]|uniref:hypothetical protein n=1 Tax=Nocardioides convexus TaxID=2712224 RepID=UPI0024187928|nr:hypothetical protein [Nocardioides convexus]
MTLRSVAYDKTAIRPGFGTEYRGLEAADLVSPDVLADIKDSLAHTHLVVLRQTPLTSDQQARARPRDRPAGALQHQPLPPPGLPGADDRPNVVKDGKPVGVARVGNFWHQDSSLPARPAGVHPAPGRAGPGRARRHPLRQRDRRPRRAARGPAGEGRGRHGHPPAQPPLPVPPRARRALPAGVPCGRRRGVPARRAPAHPGRPRRRQALRLRLGGLHRAGGGVRRQRQRALVRGDRGPLRRRVADLPPPLDHRRHRRVEDPDHLPLGDRGCPRVPSGSCTGSASVSVPEPLGTLRVVDTAVVLPRGRRTVEQPGGRVGTGSRPGPGLDGEPGLPGARCGREPARAEHRGRRACCVPRTRRRSRRWTR